MNLLPTTLQPPTVTITDAAVETTLGRAVRIINPLLDVLWGTDPLGLKRRRSDTDDGPLDKVADGFAWALNAADVPGTSAWDDMDADARIHWWVWRVGALNTVAVAFPGVLGAVGRRLPIQDLLGFVSQAIVLCAVARELGVSDYRPQVRMLAAVLCGRDLAGVGDGAGPDLPSVEISRTPLGIAKALWNLVGLFDESATNSPSARTRVRRSGIWACSPGSVPSPPTSAKKGPWCGPRRPDGTGSPATQVA